MIDSPTRRGLTGAEVEASRRRHGINELTPPPRATWWQEYLGKFNDPVIRILMLAAGLAIAVGLVDGHIVEGVGILVAIFLATFLAYWNEHRAAREFDVLNRSEDAVPAKVVRDGGYTRVPKRDVVVGDIVFVEVGEEVPADGTLLEAVGLLVSEAKLTGESAPAEKSVGAESASGTAYGAGLMLRGTTVADGYGTFEVTAVGDATAIGRTLRESTESPGLISPLNRQLARLSKIIGVVGFGVAIAAFAALVGRGALVGNLMLSPGQWLLVAGLVAGVGVAMIRVWLPVAHDALALLRGGVDEGDDAETGGWWAAVRPWLLSIVAGVLLFALVVIAGLAAGLVSQDPGEWLPRPAAREFLRNFMIAVTIIVVAVPEGLAMSVTLSLAYSMRKMTAQQTLVRRMDATEAIGAATVICSDKTGTLTANEMRVAAGVLAGVEATGLPTDPVLRKLLLEAIASNTTAHLGREGGEIRAIGNPTEGALLLWLHASEDDYDGTRRAFALKKQWTFSTERKFMASYGESADGGEVLHVKGAPEVLFAGCERFHSAHGPEPLAASDRAAIAASLAGFQNRGMRTLGFAYRTEGGDIPDSDGLTTGLIWLGHVALADPVRPEVPAAVAACRRAGIAVKVVTGDIAATAAEVALQIGVLTADAGAGAVVTGAEFAALTDADASAAAERLVVMARARPADKLRLVRLLKERGHIVAVTGDGVNDGPALNYADVGLAMGKSGTAVAKEASDIVLLDDSFGSIVTAVKWGRTLYENIQRFILFQLTINVCALGLAVLGPFIGYELPLTVLQMLWVNLIMDTFAALALATEPPHPGVLDRSPREPSAFIVTPPMARFVFGVGAAFLAVLVGLVLWLQAGGELPPGDEPTRGGTIVFNAFVLLQFWNLFNAKGWGRRGSVLRTLGNNISFLLVAGAILVGQVLLVQFGGAVFRTVPLSLADWGVLLAATSIVFWAGEIWRALSVH